jgi:thiosulfate/3-mercaptopyruvate sulfurtransferase
MTYTTLISTNELALHLTDADWAVLDCRFSLADPERGRRDFAQAHIPGALYAHLNEDLSGPIVPGVTGRHPLPAVEFAAQKFAQWGIDDRVQAVVYDDSGGGLAARLWWMLRWLGHDTVAVLDGDWRKWLNEGRAISSRAESRPARSFVPRPRADLLITTAEIEVSLRGAPPERSAAQSKAATKQSSTPQEIASHRTLAMTADFKLFDSRTADRYRGENETIDPIAGHIHGAISAPYPDNLNPDSTFRADDELRARFTALLGDTPAMHTAFYCGSGVTAAHNILALKHAGFGDARLYAGSWSEWITNPQRPIAAGNE